MTLLAGLLTSPAVAHADGVYESLGNIPVGRIFLSPEERARLDKVRDKTPLEPKRVSSSGDVKSRVFDADAAGFIVSDSGATRVWKNGDFVASASASDVRFPGQVRVVRRAQANDDNADSENPAEPSVEAGDEKE